MYHYPSLLCRIDSTLCIDYSGNVWCIGSNSNGELGFDINENKQIFPFKQLSSLTNIKMISCGRNHTICLNYDGEVFSFGKNISGELGIGKTKDELEKTFIPQKIQVPSCKQVSCGENFTLCLSDDGYIYSFGKNSNRQLGVTCGNCLSPQQIPDLSDVEYIVCGQTHSICITYHNQYYVWGNNSSGQLGLGHKNSCYQPTQSTNWPKDIIDIRCGAYHSLLLTQSGQVYSFGSNCNGQLCLSATTQIKLVPNLVENIPQIKRISCGEYYNMFIDIDNQLWGCGSNYYRQQGLGEKIGYIPTPKKIFNQEVMDISYGGRTTFIKTLIGTILTCGDNSCGQIGIKTSEEKQVTLIETLTDQEDIWCSLIGKSKAKSARK